MKGLIALQWLKLKSLELKSLQLLLQVHFMGTVCCVICYSILKQRSRKKTNTWSQKFVLHANKAEREKPDKNWQRNILVESISVALYNKLHSLPTHLLKCSYTAMSEGTCQKENSISQLCLEPPTQEGLQSITCKESRNPVLQALSSALLAA